MTTFTKWFLLAAVTGTGLLFAETKGALSLIIENDKSYLGLLIMGLFTIMTIRVGQLAYHTDVANDKQRIELNKKQEIIPITNLIYKTFVEKFNDTYGGSLLEEQKRLLQSYVSSFGDNGIQLKIFLNEELGRLKSIINSALRKEEIKSDAHMVEKTSKVLNLMENFKVKKLDKDMLAQIMKIQNLAKEIQD